MVDREGRHVIEEAVRSRWIVEEVQSRWKEVL
jgi:hypothetical protein